MKLAFNPLAGSMTSSTRRSHARIKLNAGYRCENVNANRLTAHAKERALLCEVGGGQTLKRRSELRQCRENRLGVIRRQPLPEYRGLWLPVAAREWRRRKPHDKILNAVRVQNGQEFFEVWVHLEPRPSSRSVPG